MNAQVKKIKNEIIKIIEAQNMDEQEISNIDKAISFAVKKHENQLRKSGEPYVTHPLEVAKILLSWGLDADTIVASILHDVVEDTNTSLEEIKKEFGEVVEKLVDAVTKVSTYSNKNRASSKVGDSISDEEVMSVIKIFLGMSKDLRVIIIKVADRLHNMRTIKHLRPEKQAKIARETKDIYANIAGRLGMYEVKTELDDICMQILQPQNYKKVKLVIEKKIKKHEKTFKDAIEKIQMSLNNNHIQASISSRIKSIYSTSEKMLANENVNDLFAIRVIVEKMMDCYLALGVIHCNFFNMQNSFKDFISTPKINLYQSLHTVIIYEGLNIEVQIRTKDMDVIANYGIASHWKYKSKINDFDVNFDSLIQMLTTDQNDDVKNSSLAIIKKIAKQKFINVLDKNKMEWRSIPENTCLLDYAYLTNRSKFEYVKEFIVNNQNENMYYVIKPGDTIEVIYSSNKTINKHWEFISNDSTIKKYIHEQVQELKSNLENSSEKFLNSITKECGNKVTKSFILEFIQKHFNIHSIKDFLDSMRAINISHNDVMKLFSSSKSERKKMINQIKSVSWKWLIAKSLFQAEDVNFFFNEIKITNCCSKIPPLEVVGCINGNCLDVHRYNCSKINHRDKMIVLKWDKDKIKKSGRSFKSKVILNGYFTSDSSTYIINTVMRYKGVISKFNLSKNKSNNEFIIEAEIYVKNYSNLEKMAVELQNKGIIYSWKLI